MVIVSMITILLAKIQSSSWLGVSRMARKHQRVPKGTKGFWKQQFFLTIQYQTPQILGITIYFFAHFLLILVRYLPVVKRQAGDLQDDGEEVEAGLAMPPLWLMDACCALPGHHQGVRLRSRQVLERGSGQDRVRRGDSW